MQLVQGFQKFVKLGVVPTEFGGMLEKGLGGRGEELETTRGAVGIKDGGPAVTH